VSLAKIIEMLSVALSFALLGGICVTGTIARTATNIRSGARGPVAPTCGSGPRSTPPSRRPMAERPRRTERSSLEASVAGRYTGCRACVFYLRQCRSRFVFKGG
jgi:hypothetical protein